MTERIKIRNDGALSFMTVFTLHKLALQLLVPGQTAAFMQKQHRFAALRPFCTDIVAEAAQTPIASARTARHHADFPQRICHRRETPAVMDRDAMPQQCGRVFSRPIALIARPTIGG